MNRKRYALLFSCILGFVGQVRPIPAQTPDKGDASTAGSGLDEIVVTAERRSQRLQDVPITVSTFSQSEPKNASVNSVSDLQNVVPGLTFSQFGPAAQPSIRGVSTTLSDAGAENPNALYIDGIYYGDQSVLLNEFNDVDRIEILKGPQGTLFGRNAVGGAIEIFTKGPSFEPAFDASLYSSYYTGGADSHAAPHENIQAFVTGPVIPGLLAASLSGGYSYTPGYFTNALTGSGDGFIGKGGMRGKLLLTPAEDFKVIVTGYYIKNNDAGGVSYSAVNGLSAASQYPGAEVANKPWTTLPGDNSVTSAFERTFGTSVRMEYVLPAGTLTSLSGYNNFTLPSTLPVSAAAGPAACFLNLACINYSVDFVTKEASEELDFASRDFGPVRFTSGLYFYKGFGGVVGRVQETYFPGGLLVQDDSFDNKSYAAFSEGTFTATDQLSFNLGLRYTIEPTHGALLLPGEIHSGSRTFDSTTPRVSMLYKFTPSLNGYVTYSQGFKSGASGATNQAAPVPYSAVNPEKLNAYETGLKFATPDFSANVAAWYYDYKNKQEQTFTGTSYFVTNTGPVEMYGLDTDASVRIDPHFSLRGALSWIPTAKYKDFPDASGQSIVPIPFGAGGVCAPFGACGAYFPGSGSVVGATFDATGKRLIRTPRETASMTFSYQNPIGNGNFDANTTLSYSTRYALEITDTLEQGGYATLSAQAGYKWNTGLRLGIFGRNLTNKAYLTGESVSAAGFMGSYEAPREVGISLDYAL